MDRQHGPKRNHHILPRSYLKGFADVAKPSHVWVYRRGEDFNPGKHHLVHNPSLWAIKSAAVIRDYYALDDLEGRVEYEKYENILEQHEALGNRILPFVRSKAPLTLESKVWLSTYIEMMVRRVPNRTKYADHLVESALLRFPRDLLARKAAEEGQFAQALKFTRDWDATRSLLKRQLLLEGVVRRSKAIAEAIARMTWQFFLTSAPRFFITTDNPAFFPRELGLQRANSFLTFPISSRVSLFASHVQVPDCAYVRATTAQVNLLNRVTLSGAGEWAFACLARRSVINTWAKPIT